MGQVRYQRIPRCVCTAGTAFRQYDRRWDRYREFVESYLPLPQILDGRGGSGGNSPQVCLCWSNREAFSSLENHIIIRLFIFEAQYPHKGNADEGNRRWSKHINYTV